VKPGVRRAGLHYGRSGDRRCPLAALDMSRVSWPDELVAAATARLLGATEAKQAPGGQRVPLPDQAAHNRAYLRFDDPAGERAASLAA
jgi:hypothetical protein